MSTPEEKEARRVALMRAIAEEKAAMNVVQLPRPYVPLPPPPAQPLPLKYFSECRETKSTLYVIRGVMAEGATSSLHGMPKTLKSTLAVDFGVHLASGRDWRGHRVKESRGVVYFAFERAKQVEKALAAYAVRDIITELPFAVVGRLVSEIHAPFDPESAVDQFVRTLRDYGIREVTGDRYAGQWCAQSFEKRGIHYNHSDLAKSGLYVDMPPKLMSKTIRLVDNERLVVQIASLERRTARGGRDTIDHPQNAHDDLANVVAGLASIASAPAHFESIETLRI